jgi:hypothetical protein
MVETGGGTPITADHSRDRSTLGELRYRRSNPSTEFHARRGSVVDNEDVLETYTTAAGIDQHSNFHFAYNIVDSVAGQAKSFLVY